MAKPGLTIRIAEVLLFIFFIFALAVYPGAVPNCGVIMTAIAVMTLLTLLVTQNKLKIKRRKATNYLIVLFWLDTVANVIVDSEIVSHLFYAVQFSCIVWAIDIYCNQENRLERLIQIIFWPMFLGGPIIGTIQLFNGDYLFGSVEETNMFFTTIISDARHSNPNYTALIMVMCFCLAGYLYKKQKKMVYLLGAIYSVVCVILTFSRTTIFVLVVGIVWLALESLYRMGKIKRTLRGRTLVFIVLAITVIIVAIPYVTQWVEEYLGQANVEKLLQIKENSTIEQRLKQWKASVQVVLENGFLHFLFGFGDETAEILGKITYRTMTSHNLIFSSLAERGFIGFIFTLMLYGNLFFGIIRMRKKAPMDKMWIYVCSTMILICYMMVSVLTWELYLAVILTATAMELQRNEERRLNESV